MLFRSKGNRVAITGRDPDKLKRILGENPEWIGYAIDLIRPESVLELATSIQSDLPELNLLINNAGLQFEHSFLEDSQALNRVQPECRVNLEAPIRLTLALLPLLLQSPEAAVVYTTSALGEVPKSSFPVYAASKAGLSAFATALGVQLKDTNLRVMELVPPLTETPLNAHRPARGKMNPDQVAAEFVSSLGRNRRIVRPGKARILHAIHRVSPRLARRIIEAQP